MDRPGELMLANNYVVNHNTHQGMVVMKLAMPRMATVRMVAAIDVMIWFKTRKRKMDESERNVTLHR